MWILIRSSGRKWERENVTTTSMNTGLAFALDSNCTPILFAEIFAPKEEKKDNSCIVVNSVDFFYL